MCGGGWQGLGGRTGREVAAPWMCVWVAVRLWERWEGVAGCVVARVGGRGRGSWCVQQSVGATDWVEAVVRLRESGLKVWELVACLSSVCSDSDCTQCCFTVRTLSHSKE